MIILRGGNRAAYHNRPLPVLLGRLSDENKSQMTRRPRKGSGPLHNGQSEHVGAAVQKRAIRIENLLTDSEYHELVWARWIDRRRGIK